MSTAQAQQTNPEPKIAGSPFSYYESLIYDEGGIPYYNYSYVLDTYIGLQRNPLTISNEALRFYDEYQANPQIGFFKKFFLNNADWLVNNATTKQLNGSYSYATLDYDFPWPYYNLEPPWRSAIAQSQASNVLINAHELTGNSTYLDTAKKLLNAFFIETSDGGVTNKTRDSGWWYEEYASDNENATKGSQILGGMILSVLGLNEYYNYTQDPQAKYLFDQGVLALKNDIPKYDKNGVPLYDALGKPTDKTYHGLFVERIGKLYEITEEPIFKRYLDRWRGTL